MANEQADVHAPISHSLPREINTGRRGILAPLPGVSVDTLLRSLYSGSKYLHRASDKPEIGQSC